MRKMTKQKKGQAGFTLIELIIVIVILGILAATALPKFIDLGTDARKASIEGLAGSVRSAAAMAHAKAIVTSQNAATGSIIVEGTSIPLAYGYPTANGIKNMLADVSGYSFTGGVAGSGSAGTSTISNGAVTIALCNVKYQQAAGAGLAPVITLTSSDCS